MWNRSRLTWSNDGLNQELVAVVIVAAVELTLSDRTRGGLGLGSDVLAG